MVKLDLSFFKYLKKKDFRILTAIEMGMKNHQLVPTQMIEIISGIRSGCYIHLKNVHKYKLVWHDSKCFDGYKLTYSGYDFLAIQVFLKRGLIKGLGRIIGTGKESDIYEAINKDGKVLVLKLHRLGRTSFRKIKEKRDYLKHRQNASWLYLSRLSALTEFSYLKILDKEGFVVPKPIDHNRHAILMTLSPGLLLNHIKEINNPEFVYTQCMNIIIRLARHGLIHCDFNEFNLLVNKQGRVTLIDFPQMISISHKHAKKMFQHDVDCIITFFRRRFGYSSPKQKPALRICKVQKRLDLQVYASGCEKTKTTKDKEFEKNPKSLEKKWTQEEIIERIKRENDNIEWFKHLKGSRKLATKKLLKIKTNEMIKEVRNM